MTPLFQKIILFSLIAVITIIGGGVIAILRKPNGNIRSLILHFAAGVLFSVVAVELLPGIVKIKFKMFKIFFFTTIILLVI